MGDLGYKNDSDFSPLHSRAGAPRADSAIRQINQVDPSKQDPDSYAKNAIAHIELIAEQLRNTTPDRKLFINNLLDRALKNEVCKLDDFEEIFKDRRGLHLDVLAAVIDCLVVAGKLLPRSEQATEKTFSKTWPWSAVSDQLYHIQALELKAENEGPFSAFIASWRRERIRAMHQRLQTLDQRPDSP